MAASEKVNLRQIQRQWNEENDDKCNSAEDCENFDGFYFCLQFLDLSVSPPVNTYWAALD